MQSDDGKEFYME
ncbi:hypothetical protein CGLO_13742 [Colletotrichum gloeosporioides Cg-14]|uniref:Uncharacterized protein n=1 Tax=Colletotrichum gloeosporioides (strain Cg-14) TaxID=1237896 RepID=T0L6G4_COLGC|nr:hypothetical protein CGLO_13742 [Colletotrichum gloeosporioides Cg-14]